jgi:phthiodiolone/phenolphthiodiolone dimycocerosates ketoreductase
LGTGPRQLDLATTYMDGVTCLAPFGWATPDEAARDIATVRAQLEAKGRDPDTFGFGLHTVCLLHEDPSVLDRALDNPVLRWIAGVYGRVNPANWRNEGIEPVTPDGWSYFLNYSPSTVTDEFVSHVVSQCTRPMAEGAYLVGDPSTVAARIQEYVDAGVDWVAVNDLAPLVLPLAEAQASIGRQLAVCGALKAAVPARLPG